MAGPGYDERMGPGHCQDKTCTTVSTRLVQNVGVAALTHPSPCTAPKPAPVVQVQGGRRRRVVATGGLLGCGGSAGRGVQALQASAAFVLPLPHRNAVEGMGVCLHVLLLVGGIVPELAPAHLSRLRGRHLCMDARATSSQDQQGHHVLQQSSMPANQATG